jgi:hypothetical protein
LVAGSIVSNFWASKKNSNWASPYSVLRNAMKAAVYIYMIVYV